MKKTLLTFPFNERTYVTVWHRIRNKKQSKKFSKKTQVKSKRLKFHKYRKISVEKRYITERNV